MTRDITASSINVSSGVTIKTANYRIFCTGTLTDSGTIQCNGNNASGNTGGAAIARGWFAASNAGTNGRTTTGNGGAGTGVDGIGGAGGAGGSDGGVNAGGGAGTNTAPNTPSYHSIGMWIGVGLQFSNALAIPGSGSGSNS